LTPFPSFVHWQAKIRLTTKKIVFPGVKSTFQLDNSFPYEKEITYFPIPHAQNTLFHWGKDHSNPTVLWSLFRDAVKGLDSISPSDFDGILAIKGVGIAKLTQVMYLINPDELFPVVSRVISSIDWIDKSLDLDGYK